jgi:hypothetical protein
MLDHLIWTWFPDDVLAMILQSCAFLPVYRRIADWRTPQVRDMLTPALPSEG